MCHIVKCSDNYRSEYDVIGRGHGVVFLPNSVDATVCIFIRLLK